MRFSGLIENITNKDQLLINAFKEGSEFSDADFVIAAVMDPRIHYDFLEKPKEMSDDEWANYESAYKLIVRSIVCKMADKLASSPTTSPDDLEVLRSEAHVVDEPPQTWMRGLSRKRSASTVA